MLVTTVGSLVSDNFVGVDVDVGDGVMVCASTVTVMVFVFVRVGAIASVLAWVGGISVAVSVAGIWALGSSTARLGVACAVNN